MKLLTFWIASLYPISKFICQGKTPLDLSRDLPHVARSLNPAVRYSISRDLKLSKNRKNYIRLMVVSYINLLHVKALQLKFWMLFIIFWIFHRMFNDKYIRIRIFPRFSFKTPLSITYQVKRLVTLLL